MVTVTEIAKNKILELREKDGLTGNPGVRVAVEGGRGEREVRCLSERCSCREW